jgi:hypothetical protein
LDLLLAIQDSATGTWLRESTWALFALLILHTLGMAFMAGTALALLARVAGLARQIPLALLWRLRWVVNTGGGIAILSGVLLLMAYPAKALTNPVFYLKLSLLALAWWQTLHLLKRASSDPQPSPPIAASGLLAVLIALLWLGGVTAGRLLAYTHTELLVYP